MTQSTNTHELIEALERIQSHAANCASHEMEETLEIIFQDARQALAIQPQAEAKLDADHLLIDLLFIAGTMDANFRWLEEAFNACLDEPTDIEMMKEARRRFKYWKDLQAKLYEQHQIESLKREKYEKSLQPQAEAQPGVREALRPFAEMAKETGLLKNRVDDDGVLIQVDDTEIRLDDFHRAAQVLANLTPAQPAGDVRERVERVVAGQLERHPPWINPGLEEGRAIVAAFTDAILAALSATPAVSGWRDDMENAPRDGTRVLLSHGKPVKNAPRHAYLGKYLPKYDQWLLDSGMPVSADKFRYWQPLPLPPEHGE